MSIEKARTRLRKILGKEHEFTATFEKRNDDKNILLDVKHKNKIVADHIWYSDSNKLDPDALDRNKVIFNGIPTTYADKQGERKYGISKIWGIRLIEVGEAEKEISHDYEFMRRRK